MTDRLKYARLVVGSHLYGGATDDSDQDFLDLLIPTLVEWVSNKRVIIPQDVTDTLDVRSVLLGDFVMSLGENPENTLIALSYPEYFPDSGLWLRQSTAEKMYDSGRAMFAAAPKMDPKNCPKQLGHAFRYVMGAHQLIWDHDPTYPFTEGLLERYLEYRAGNFDVEWVQDEFAHNIREYSSDLPDSERDLDEMARWVANIYMEVLHK